MKTPIPALTLTFCLIMTGCASHDPILQKQGEMEARLEQLVQANASSNARLTDLSSQVVELQHRLKSIDLEIEQLKPSYRELKSSLENTSQRLEKLAQEAVQPSPPIKVETPPPEPPPREVKADPKDAYQRALALYHANRFAEAADAFVAFLKAYPQHEYAGNAQYWIGESYYSLRDYTKALEAFTHVTTDYPIGNKTPDALLKIGFTLLSQGETAKARATLNEVVEKFPKSDAATKARERLKHP